MADMPKVKFQKNVQRRTSRVKRISPRVSHQEKVKEVLQAVVQKIQRMDAEISRIDVRTRSFKNVSKIGSEFNFF